jgi:hypothetical protein
VEIAQKLVQRGYEQCLAPRKVATWHDVMVISSATFVSTVFEVHTEKLEKNWWEVVLTASNRALHAAQRDVAPLPTSTGAHAHRGLSLGPDAEAATCASGNPWTRPCPILAQTPSSPNVRRGTTRSRRAPAPTLPRRTRPRAVVAWATELAGPPPLRRRSLALK